VYGVDEHRTALVFLLRESYYKCEASSSAGAVNHFYVYELVQGFGAATNMEYDFVVFKSVYSVVYVCSDCNYRLSMYMLRL
jgi:hypothetical protein